MDQARERLAQAMDDRRIELGIRWREVARRAGMTEQNLIKFRKGRIEVTPYAAAAVERALHWQSGSVAAVLADEPPTPQAASQVSADADSRATRASILSATPEQLVEMRQVVEDVMGSAAADEFLRRAIALRTPPPDGGRERATGRGGRAAG